MTTLPQKSKINSEGQSVKDSPPLYESTFKIMQKSILLCLMSLKPNLYLRLAICPTTGFGQLCSNRVYIAPAMDNCSRLLACRWNTLMLQASQAAPYSAWEEPFARFRNAHCASLCVPSLLHQRGYWQLSEAESGRGDEASSAGEIFMRTELNVCHQKHS